MADNTQNHVVLVNQCDQALGLANKQQAHRLGWLHRAFSIFLFRENNHQWETLLHQRHVDKYHCGGLWTNACCSHPSINTPVSISAQLRLQTEMGIAAPIKPAGHFIYKATCPNGLIEHELDHVFIGFYAQDEVGFNTQEVMATKWVTLDQLKHDLKHTPEHFTPWLEAAFYMATQGLCIDVGSI